MAACACGVGLGNTGQPNCLPIAGVAKKLVFVEYTDSDGAINGIPVGTALDDAFVTGKINEADTSKRFYFSPEIDNVEDVKADTVFETLNSGANVRVQEGVRTFTGVFVKADPVFLGKLKQNICVKMGVFVVDNAGNFIGSISSDGATLNPILVDNNTFNPILVKTTDTTVQKVQLSFEFSRLELDENLRMFAASDFAVSPLSYRGLLDVSLDEVSVSTTTLVVSAAFEYGTIKSLIALEGADDDSLDWVLTNTTTPGAVSVSTVTETPAGTYTFDYSGDAQTLGNSYSLALVKDGFEAVALTGTF